MNFSGHNREPYRDDFGIEVFAEDVVQFLAREKIDSAHIFGYSMGGYVALWLAHRCPERVSKIITLGTKFDWSPESAQKEIGKLNPEKIKEKVPAFARILENRHGDWKKLVEKTAAMMEGLGSNPLLTEQVLSSINHRALILLGDQDDMADRAYSEQVAKCLPKGEFRLLENTTHPIERINTGEVGKLIGGFFSS